LHGGDAGMTRFFAGALLLLCADLAVAQQAPAPSTVSDAARALVGVWELSNPDRDRRCTLTFKLDGAPQGRVVTLGPTCGAAFPDVRPTAAWTMGGDDALKLVDPKGVVLFELTEVESGMYETTPTYTHYFLQTLAATNKERITDDLFGDWQITRGPSRPICELTLGNTAYDPDSFVVMLKPGCDASITRFAPVAWRLDRGQFVMIGAGNQSWRCEENEANIWSRIPAARPPVLMVKP
jgi:Protease inhibitor Inh